ncbi:helix-turn-helix domain-containing protein [Nitratidesulfovibrio sp. SRB-5]|uniref:helix-turn-helix domain-containing protein n=1 Tax=Nitratidesulfovibrio sp. SRB-5 TaxID=2872636 RepID=UPI001024C71C|nr:helix-turn-helix transcriptional regulator [Nitratidesulfovibrio sp. SRB-5]MBZ2172892.1 helix-turn-helix transcriptional regulator [Nitratidesulfovibrio sp. SRB-5]RXF76957.1 XRE family transcriptional regulator [Desulfovibrio sp. DS-1]
MPGYSTLEKQQLMALGTTIRQIRESLGWSQEQLAERVELHRTYIGGVERGERNLCLLNILAIAEAMGMPPGRLIGRAFPDHAASTPLRLAAATPEDESDDC